MRKIETIWHKILYDALAGNFKNTQQKFAKAFGYSISTVNYALDDPAEMGAIRKTGKFFILEDFDKLLYYWASRRKLEKDIIYRTYVDKPVTAIEGEVPPNIIYGAYSAARKLLSEPPADYSKVYIYADKENMPQVKQRFALSDKKGANLFVLRPPPALSGFGGITSLPHTFVDIWNLKDWYYRDFTRALEEEMHAILS